MMIDKRKLVKSLVNKPVKFARLLGFDKMTDLHNQWIHDMIKAKEDKTLMSHRASYKTTCVSIALALIMVLLPNKRIMFMRKTENDIKEVINQVKKILLNPHTLYIVQCLYGVELKLTVSSTSELSTNLTTDVKGTSQLVGIGTGGSLTGKHFDIIFTDDIINIQDRISKAERERTKMIYQELQNIKNRGGRIYNTLTPWHKDDASTLMPEAERYDCYSTGLISDEEIEEIKSKMVPSLFSANYELKHIASEDVIFSNPQYTDNFGLVQQGIAQVDAGFYGEDYTALSIIHKIDGKYYVHGRCWRKHVEECYADIKAECDKYLYSKLHIEKNADKGLVARDLKNLGMRVNAYNESMNKYIKIVTYLKIEWNNVIFDTDTDEEYIEQICDYNENASHDDCPDSLSSGIRVLYNKTGEKYQPLFM